MRFSSLVAPLALLSSAAAYVNVAYYTDYARWSGYTAGKLPASDLSHVNYAFAAITSNGTVVPRDKQADYLSGKPFDEKENNAWGNVRDLYALKQKNRRMKVLLSIGGQNSADMFVRACMDSAKRRRFAQTAVKLMADYGMDGIDLDYEFPTNELNAARFHNLMEHVRGALDDLAAANKQNYRYTLSAALPAGPQDYALMPLQKMGQVLDQLNIMTYELCGIWNSVVCHTAPLYADSKNPKTTPLTADQVISHYIKQGVPASKINIGMPLYGRAFLKSKGMGTPFNLEKSQAYGAFPYNELPKPGAVIKEGANGVGATYSESSKTGTVISFEGAYSTKVKANYVKSKKLGGTMFWESSQDKTGSDSLMSLAKSTLGSIDSSYNQLSYPTSEFLNIRTGRV